MSYSQPMPKIGVDFLHYVPIISDTEAGIVYGEATRLRGQTEISYSAGSDISTFYADNGPYTSDTAVGDQELTINVADIPPKHFAQMIGGDYAAALNLGSNFVAKERGVLYRIKVSGGPYRYMRFWKGVFGLPGADVSTQAESVDYQTSELNYKAVNTVAKGYFVQIVDDDNEDVLAMGITPEILEANMPDFNWDPFTGSSAFAPAIAAYVSPSIVIGSNTGAVNTPVLIGISGGRFSGTITSADITISSLPTSLAVGNVTRVNDSVISVELAGVATAHTPSDSVSGLKATLAQTAIVDATAAIESSLFSITFEA